MPPPLAAALLAAPEARIRLISSTVTTVEFTMV
jgi:hypothetical protein